MNPLRLLAGTLTLGLLGLSPVLLAPAADAAGGATTTTFTTDRPTIAYGDAALLSGAVTAADGTTPYGGTATLQVMTADNPAWTSIATDTSPGYLYFGPLQPAETSTYKVVFSGFSAYDDSYAPSESAPVTVVVTRVIKAKTKRLKVIGKVSPDFGRQKVVILAKKGKKLKRYAKVKTDKKGRFTFTAPRRDKFRFAVVVPGDARYGGYYASYTVHTS